MAYSLNFVFDFGSLTGLTLNGKLYDHLGAQVGATIVAGFVEIGNGVYSYLHSALPDGGRGVMVAYKSTDATIKVVCGYNPQTTENTDIKTSVIQTQIAALNNVTAAQVVSALMAYAIATGKTVQEALKDIWSVTVGDAAANDANTPTLITYDLPDGSVQRTHTLTATTRVQS